MESWLTFFVRLVVVVFVGVCVWYVLGSLGPSFWSNYEGSLRRTLGIEPLVLEGVETQNRSMQVRNIVALVVGLPVFAVLFFLIETRRFNRFKVAVHRVQELQGNVQFGASNVANLGNFYFGKTTVDLSGANLIGVSLPALERLPMVMTIRLCEADIDGEMLKVVGRCRKLRSLDLSGSAVGDSEVAELGVLPRLEALFLNHTNVTTKVLGFLMYHPSLSKIEYDGTGISHEAIEEFCDRN